MIETWNSVPHPPHPNWLIGRFIVQCVLLSILQKILVVASFQSNVENIHNILKWGFQTPINHYHISRVQPSSLRLLREKISKCFSPSLLRVITCLCVVHQVVLIPLKEEEDGGWKHKQGHTIENDTEEKKPQYLLCTKCQAESINVCNVI